jgi:hypothetical protein
MNWVIAQLLWERVLAAITDTGFSPSASMPLNGVYVGLGSGPGTPLTPSNVIGDITEALYTGYGRLAVVWNTIVVAPNNYVESTAASQFFQPTGSAVQEQELIAFLADSHTGGNLLASCVILGGGWFAGGVLTGMTIVPQIRLPFGPLFGGPLFIF